MLRNFFSHFHNIIVITSGILSYKNMYNKLLHMFCWNSIQLCHIP